MLVQVSAHGHGWYNARWTQQKVLAAATVILRATTPPGVRAAAQRLAGGIVPRAVMLSCGQRPDTVAHTLLSRPTEIFVCFWIMWYFYFYLIIIIQS